MVVRLAAYVCLFVCQYLGSSANVEFNQQTCGPNCPLMNHLEAFGRSTADTHTVFTVEQGIHLSK